RDRAQHLGKGCVTGDLLEYLAFGSGDPLGALALGDVGDAAAYQAAVGAGQAHQANFADELLAGGIAMGPLEHRHLAGERLLDVAVRALRGGRTIGLQRWAQGEWAALEQARALESKESLRDVVRIDEAARID